jgi:hypothetical protein
MMRFHVFTAVRQNALFFQENSHFLAAWPNGEKKAAVPTTMAWRGCCGGRAACQFLSFQDAAAVGSQRHTAAGVLDFAVGAAATRP